MPMRPWFTAVALFLIGWATRALFVFATPDAAWPYSFGFKGDAIEFLRHASHYLGIAPSHDLGLPMRPPGTAQLISWLWDGRSESIRGLRHVWIVMGAALAPVLYAATRQRLGERAATFAGAFTALASGPLLLSASLSNEVPYLLGATVSVGVLPALRDARRFRTLGFLAWGAGQGLLCVLRAEHLLWFLVGVLWASHGHQRSRGLALATLAFAIALAPTLYQAHAAVENFNEREIELVYRMDWDRDAIAAVEAQPQFVRQSTIAFVEGTVQVRRGRGPVKLADLQILREAYDTMPEKLGTWPFVAMTGGMNFYIANHPACADGFTRTPLFEPPPLQGGPARYPPNLQFPTDLALSYPPHLHAINHGFAMGMEVIGEDVRGWLGRVVLKLDRLSQGAFHGLGARAVPVGMSGVRRQVDIVVPEGGLARVWQFALLAMTAVGCWFARGNLAARPWLLWLAVRVGIAILFYGYARQGALLIPTVAVVLGLLFDRWFRPWLPKVLLAVVVAVLAADIWYFAAPPTVVVDGFTLEEGKPDLNARTNADRRVEIR